MSQNPSAGSHPSNLGRAAALCVALALLGVQIYAAIDYTRGSPLITTILMVVSLMGLAVMPLLAGWAWSMGQRAIAAALVLVTVCLLIYSLPATISRAGDNREALASKHEIAKRDHKAARERKNDAKAALVKECRSGDGGRCRGRKAVYEIAQQDYEKAKTVAVASNGDLGTEILSWATGGLDKQTLRWISTLCMALGFDLGVCALMALVAVQRPKRIEIAAEAPKPEPPPATKEPKPKKEKAPVAKGGKAWIASFKKRNPEAPVHTAWARYQDARKGKGGRRMNRNTFARTYERMAA
jgi:hypothetical protein